LQDRYVGDVGDFGKYALLPRLCGSAGEQPVRLGVIWLLFPDESHNADGRHTAYLGNSDFRGLDDDLIERLQTIIKENRRGVASVLSIGLLPPETVSCHEPIPTGASQRESLARSSNRSLWVKCCLDPTNRCDLVFFGPDNGLEVRSVPKDHPKSGKYIYWNELALFWKRGKSLLIYHHLNRIASALAKSRNLPPDPLPNWKAAWKSARLWG
jgi:hypothetical protein